MVELSLKNVIYKNRLLLDFLDGNHNLNSYHNGSSFETIDKAFYSKRDLSVDKRSILVEVLSAQYHEINQPIPANVNLLKNKDVYTITTGHQLCFMGGPQFFIHKIISTINISRKLKRIHPDVHFVPVFWMASEDHDFEEISKTSIFGQDFKLNGVEDTIAVGRLKSELFKPLFEEVKSFFQNDVKFKVFEEIFSKALTFDNWSQSTRYWVHQLFQDYGLVIIDADDKKLKEQFQSTVELEISKRFVHSNVLESNKQLSSLGYKPNINPREINLFYHENNRRERIKYDGDSYQIGKSEFTSDELVLKSKSDVERFSPNVLLRPLFQETILPNLAYVGGPSELTYWLQLKETFDGVNLNYPKLILRDHFAFISAKQFEKWKHHGLKAEQLLHDFNDLTAALLMEENKDSLDFSGYHKQIDLLQKDLTKLVIEEDKSLEATVGSSINNMKKSLDVLQGKLKKSIKRKNEQKLNQIQNIQRKIFTNGVLNERKESFIGIYINDPQSYVDLLIENSNPGNPNLNLIIC